MSNFEAILFRIDLIDDLVMLEVNIKSELELLFRSERKPIIDHVIEEILPEKVNRLLLSVTLDTKHANGTTKS